MSDQDIRWIRRFNHFKKALALMTKFIEKKDLNELEQQGLIQAFEYTYELAWNTLKDYFEAQGEAGIHGSRDALRLAFRRGVIADGQTWMDMLESRTQTSHTYQEDVAQDIAGKIFNRYFPEFQTLRAQLARLAKEGA